MQPNNKTRQTSKNAKQKSIIAFKAVDKILDKWGCSLDEKLCLLGQMKKSTFYKYREAESAEIGHDLLERLSYILNIHASLRILFLNSESGYNWVKKQNSAPFYGGRSALEVMLQGNVVDLWSISSRLNVERGGWG